MTGLGERDYLRGGNPKRDLPWTPCKRNAWVLGAVSMTGGRVVGQAPGTQAKRRRLDRKPQSYLLLCEKLLLFICLFQLLLPDLQVLLLVDHSRKLVISVFSLNQVTLLFHVPLAGWLSLVATVLVMAEIYTILTFLVRCIHII